MTRKECIDEALRLAEQSRAFLRRDTAYGVALAQLALVYSNLALVIEPPADDLTF
jgi:hypothetical protein